MTIDSTYLNSLKKYLRLDPACESNVIRELQTHLEDKSHELREFGLSEEEATKTAARSLGSPQLIAKQIYEVYSQGSWRQASFAALPHLLIALLFALHCWHSTIWLLAILTTVTLTAIYGWCHGKPTWLFPWLGCCFIPVLIVGVLLIYLPGGWAWFAVVAYVPLPLFVIIQVTKQIIKLDWLCASLMLLPVPIVLGWTLVIVMGNGLLGFEQIYEAAPWIALSFVVLAVTVMTFIRIKQRWIKTGTLLVPEALVLLMVSLGIKNAISFWGWLFIILLSLLFLLLPALLEHKIRQGYSQSLKLLR